MERRFSCTACGKCCYGLLPLTIDDALAHADKFPLVVIWTPVRQGGRSYRNTAELGITIQLGKRKRAAVRIAPTAYIPPGFPCPELIHALLDDAKMRLGSARHNHEKPQGKYDPRGPSPRPMPRSATPSPRTSSTSN